jgi:hypothetical protein
MTLSNAAANAAADAVMRLLDGGFLDIYDGARPDADAAVTTQTRLGRFSLSNPCAGAAVAGVATFNSISAAVALASGSATWFRMRASDETAVFDGSAGTGSGVDVTLSSAEFVQGALVQPAAFTYRARKG